MHFIIGPNLRSHYRLSFSDRGT